MPSKKQDQALRELYEAAQKLKGERVRYYSGGKANNYGFVVRSHIDWELRCVWVFLFINEKFLTKISFEQIKEHVPE